MNSRLETVKVRARGHDTATTPARVPDACRSLRAAPVSPRPRKVSDDDVFAATQRAMSRLGPGQLTLAEIAGEAGLTAGALVQRFGSKRALLLGFAARAAEGAPDFLAQLRTRHASPLDALRDYAACIAQLATSPAALARNLAYLQIDLTDDDFRQQLARQARATRRAVRALLDDAVSAGELLSATDTRALARTIEVALNGSLLTWAFYLEGSATRWIRTDLDAVVAPHLAARKAGPAPRPRRSRAR
jgi:AcrR family transcriptional regulator